MSRHVIPNAPGSPPGRETTVGWNAGLNTFWAQAYDPPESSDPGDDAVKVFRHGDEPDEILWISQLARILDRYYIDLPADVAAELVEDQQREGDQTFNRPESALTAQAGEAG